MREGGEGKTEELMLRGERENKSWRVVSAPAENNLSSAVVRMVSRIELKM